jgi:phosphoglucosamine mutase
MKKLFGTDGMRGEAGRFPLDEQTIRVAGYSLARQFAEKNRRGARFVTGRDTRESGGWIERALHAGAIAAGAECFSAGVITTPGVAFLAQKHQFDAGIVVSASHNPFHDNGIKIFSPSGKKLDEETERRIEADIHDGVGDIASDILLDESRAAEFQQEYIAGLEAEHAGLNLSGLRIVADCANGAASHLAPGLLRHFGADVVAIHASPDGRNINLDCGSTHIENLRKKVVEETADLGVAFDGDADRSLFADENGNLVDGDAVMYAMALYLKKHGKLAKDTVVATVMSNLGLEAALIKENIKLLRASVGDKYVLEELLKTETAIGGEQSGHIIFPENSLVGDGMRTALLLLEALKESGQTLSGITAGFKRFPQVLVNVKVREKRPFDEVPEILAVSQRVTDELGSSGRLLLRYSGTENLARVMIEGEQKETITTQAESIADAIRASLG